jgi:hypothetical protein
MPGDDCAAYIRRLALANHMRPLYLRRYLKTAKTAAVSGSTGWLSYPVDR